MGGDYTRVRFDPAADYTGVHKQQGRVALDADFNEQVDIGDRQDRARAMDIMGRCVRPVSDPANADAFRVIPTGPGAFDIGVGRVYVDGLLVECHGRPPHDVFDPALAERRGAAPVAYAAPAPDGQPYLPPPLPPAFGGVGATDLAYLDVWQREVTVIEAPALREVALGGPDTTTRRQTVWQVRLMPAGGAADCDDAVPGWDELTRPSAGRLTTEITPAPPAPAPCEVEAPGGYTGLENRLYRVEIHTPGPLGTARFKWSRDNASVAAGVEAIATGGGVSRVAVSSLGHDQVMRFQTGDWVEVLDDVTEWSQAAGFLAQVGAIDQANRILDLTPPIPAGLFDPTDATRHARVRRWDHAAAADPDGQIATAAGPVAIEAGISVRFAVDPTIAGGEFRVGDYWVFAARTADGSVEELLDAPPRGIHHHHCRLALVTWGATPADTVVDECIPEWPPRTGEGCCTEVVFPGESIQDAIDRLPDAGGCVCLKAGVHEIGAELVIARSSITLHGESAGAVVRRATGGQVLLVGDVTGAAFVERIAVHDVRFEVAEGAVYMVGITLARDVAVRDCELVALPEAGLGVGIGVLVSECAEVAVARTAIERTLMGVYVTGCEGIAVEECRVEGPTLLLAPAPAAAGIVGVLLEAGVTGPARIARNTIADHATGIAVREWTEGVLVLENGIERPAVTAPGTEMRALVLPGGPPTSGIEPGYVSPGEDRAFAIAVGAPDAVIADNTMNLASVAHGGIYVANGPAHVDRNRVRSDLTAAGDERNAIGIAVEHLRPEVRLPHVLVRGNVLSGVQHGIALASGVATGFAGAQVRENRMDLGAERVPGAALHGVALQRANDTVIADNAIAGAPVGIGVYGGWNAHVVGNRVDHAVFGILAAEHGLLRAADNVVRVVEVGAVWGNALLWADVDGNTLGADMERPVLLLFLAGGAANRLRANVTQGGLVGIVAYQELAPLVEDCTTSLARQYGIIAWEVSDARVSRSRALGCGWASPGALGAGIVGFQAATRVTVDGCEVLETGRGPTGAVAGGALGGIVVTAVASAHLHDNHVRGPVPPEGTAVTHTGMSLSFGIGGEVLDNVITGAGPRPLLSVPSLRITDEIVLRYRELLVSDNRFSAVGYPENGSVVVAAAERLTAMGNQLRVDSEGPISFNFTNTSRLSAVGNVTSTNWIGVPPAPFTLPTPFTAFNHVNVP